MKRLTLVLLLMILWDFSLHLVGLLGIEKYHILYPTFSSQLFYDIFWTVYLAREKEVMVMNKNDTDDTDIPLWQQLIVTVIISLLLAWVFFNMG